MAKPGEYWLIYPSKTYTGCRLVDRNGEEINISIRRVSVVFDKDTKVKVMG